jgi:hypothetical protein
MEKMNSGYLRTVLRRIFGTKRDKVTGGCRKLHSEELHNVDSSPDIIMVTNKGA